MTAAAEPIDALLTRIGAEGAPLVTITTYERAEARVRSVAALGRDLRGAASAPVVVVLRDAAPSDYGRVARALAREFGARGVLVEATRHLAKLGLWRAHQQIMDVARALAARWHLSLHDDERMGRTSPVFGSGFDHSLPCRAAT